LSNILFGSPKRFRGGGGFQHNKDSGARHIFQGLQMQIWYFLGCAVSKGPQQGCLWSPFRVLSKKKNERNKRVIERPQARKSPRFFGHFESVICKAKKNCAERGKA